MTALPLPLGELLERLRAEGFSVTPGQYGRVFTVLESLFPDGHTAIDNHQLATLRGMLGPIVCRTAVEQERFGAVFDAVMANAAATQPVLPEPEGQHEEIGNEESSTKRPWLVGLLLILGAIALSVWLYDRYGPYPPSPPVIDSCSVNFGVKAVRGKVITFENRSPGIAAGLQYVWDFGDGSSTLTTSQTLVQHAFEERVDASVKKQVTLRGVGCPLVDDPISTSSPAYIPRPLSFLRLPVSTQYTLSNWVPLLLMGLTGLLGGGWWVLRRRRRQQQAAQRPTDGPFFLGFPPQDEAIQPSASLVSWAQQLQQREESERHVLAIGPTIRRTIQNGGMPTVQFESIKRRPRYLILIDERSAYDQQARLYAYVMGVLTSRSVEMDVFFFHSDPRYCWNENYPKGLSISDIFRLYSTHYLVLVTEGARLFDYDRNEVVNWATEALGGWTSRALLTPIYPANWHYLEAALSRFFILLPATPDGQFLLRDYLGQPDNVPSFEELLRQFKVLPGTPNRGIFAANTSQITAADVANFLKLAIPGSNLDEKTEKWLFTWACATAVFPTPDWAITLAIGRALEHTYQIDGLVSSTNILRLTALPWLRQDSIPEPLRTQLLAQLPPDVSTVARQSVVQLLNGLRPSPGSIAFEEHQLRLWEQEYHLKHGTLGQLTTYQTQTDLIQDAAIRQRLERQERLETRYQPAALLLVLLVPLLLYLTPPQKQVAGLFMPFFNRDSTTLDSAAFYNNRAVDLLEAKQDSQTNTYREGVAHLFRSVQYRTTFQALYNLNSSRYNEAVSVSQESNSSLFDQAVIQEVLSPTRQADSLLLPLQLFDQGWVPDSAAMKRYLTQLVNQVSNDDLFYFANIENQQSINSESNAGIEVNNPVNRKQFDQLASRAKLLFRWPGTLEFVRYQTAQQADALANRLRSFRLTPAQRDLLIGLEAARIIFYFGGPQRSQTVRLEETDRSGKTNTAGKGVDNQTKAVRSRRFHTRPRPINPANMPTATRTTKASAGNNYYRPSSQQADSVSRVSDSLLKPVPTTSYTTVDPPATTTNEETTGKGQTPNQTESSANNPVAQKSQKTETIDENDLEQVQELFTKCTGKSNLSFSLPDGEKRTIKLFDVVRLSENRPVYQLTVYCDDTPQTIRSKRGFTHAKVFVSRSNQVIWNFYQQRRVMVKD